MNYLKFFFSDLFYVSYLIVSALISIALIKGKGGWKESPLLVKIGILIALVGGTGGMIYHSIITFLAQ